MQIIKKLFCSHFSVNKGLIHHVVQSCYNYNITFRKLEIHTVKMRPISACYTSGRGARHFLGIGRCTIRAMLRRTSLPVAMLPACYRYFMFSNDELLCLFCKKKTHIKIMQMTMVRTFVSSLPMPKQDPSCRLPNAMHSLHLNHSSPVLPEKQVSAGHFPCALYCLLYWHRPSIQLCVSS